MSRALSRSGVLLLLSRFLIGGIFICLHREHNEVSKITKGGRSGEAAYLRCRWLQVARLAIFDLLKSRKLKVFLASPFLLRSLSKNCSEAAEAPPHRCSWAHIARKKVLARESHGAFFLLQQYASCKGNGRAGETVSRDYAQQKRTIKTIKIFPKNCTFFVHVLSAKFVY